MTNSVKLKLKKEKAVNVLFSSCYCLYSIESVNLEIADVNVFMSDPIKSEPFSEAAHDLESEMESFSAQISNCGTLL